MDTTPPSHSDRRAALQTAGEMLLNLVPGVGGSLAVAITRRMNDKLDRRRDAWFTNLAVGLEDLRQKLEGLDVEALADDDVFVDAVVTASRVAVRTLQQEKLDAARNAVLNVALPGAPDEDEQQVFFGL